MPWFHVFLTSISRSRARSQPGLGRRALAATLSLVLVLGTVSPGIALAGEADSEQEGSAPPGALPGLEEGPELAPGGEESALEELPGSTVGGEESEEGPPIETEPAQESELPAPAPEAAEPTAKAPPSPAEGAPDTSPPAPEYGPAYEPAPASPPIEAVENQAITAPESSPPSPPDQAAPEAVQAAPEAPAPASPSEAPESNPAPAPATAAKPGGTVGALAGHPSYTVQSGDCLWSIAERLLPAGADVAEVEAEVARLWRLNAARIGTGDPSLIYAGTDLVLR
jgi:nucleoid-associated protein YgaU